MRMNAQGSTVSISMEKEKKLYPIAFPGLNSKKKERAMKQA